MRLRLFIILAFCAAAFLSSCSRESSLKANPNLKNNHSVVFAFRNGFGDDDALRAFTDSIASLDSVETYDTLTITVHDTVHFLGFLKYNANKVPTYYWHFDDQDTNVTGANATPMQWVYHKVGVYSPRFIAVDANNARDTAGTGQYIRVVDFPPVMKVPVDTVWGRAKSAVTFPIVARDSFGTIVSVRIAEIDSSYAKLDSAKLLKKIVKEAKEWETKAGENDTLFITVPYDAKKMDSLSNRSIYVLIVDDDSSMTYAPVYIHINQLPKLILGYPNDGVSVDINASQNFFAYQATDADNQAAIRYFIRVAPRIKNSTKPPVLNDGDLITPDGTTETNYEMFHRGVDSLFNNMKSPNNKNGMKGNLYWDVWVTDGYDTVYADRVDLENYYYKDQHDTTPGRPRKFTLGDPSNPDRNFAGYANFQGWKSNHVPVELVFIDSLGNRTRATTEEASGYFNVKVKNDGVYSIIARDASSYKFGADTIKKQNIQEGDFIELARKLLLPDTSKPRLSSPFTVADSSVRVDTLTTRSVTFNGTLADYGSQVEKLNAFLDKEKANISSPKNTTKWTSNLSKLDEGRHVFQLVAKDSAGLLSDTLIIPFFVRATNVKFTVNGGATAIIGNRDTDTLKFTLQVKDAFNAQEKTTWEWEIEGTKHTAETKFDTTTETASFVITGDSLEKWGAKSDARYTMNVSTADYSAAVLFGLLGDNSAAYFREPSADTTFVSKNDSVLVSITALKGLLDPELTINWSCDNANLSTGRSCPGTQTSSSNTVLDSTVLAWKTTGLHRVILSLNGAPADTVLVMVVEDPPTIKINNTVSETQKINSVVNLEVSGKDKYGTINSIAWGCSRGSVIATDETKTIANPKSTLDGEKISITIPTADQDKPKDFTYRCRITLIDDDQESSSIDLSFNVKIDAPSINLDTKNGTVKINGLDTISGTAIDTLGTINRVESICGTSLKALSHPDSLWDEIPSTKTGTVNFSSVIRVPQDPGTYYCLVRAIDNDNQSAIDTAKYNVVLDPPHVEVWPSETITKTINDSVDLVSYASDELGIIVKQEWGCGPKSASNIGITATFTEGGHSVSSQFKTKLPSVAQNGYRCIVRATDDDGLSASDTALINIIQAPPRVTVNNESIIARTSSSTSKGVIVLGATAEDMPNYPGEIVKREWSCGNAGDIEKNWKEVSTYDTLWTAPSTVSLNYMCVARATDDDGNQAMDTMLVKFTTAMPVIQVKEKNIYLSPGDWFTLDATVNDAWQGINWFSWVCYDSTTHKAVEKQVKYNYHANNNTLRLPRDSSYTEGNSLYCIISAEETSTKETFTDTTHVSIVTELPTGVITAADTVYLWSGDLSVPDEAIYFYTEEWGGFNSIMGPLGNKNKQVFRWNFDNLDDKFYQGDSLGNLDTNVAQFNTAFIRRITEGSMTITLDYRDSSNNTTSPSFMLRHKAEPVSRTVYFRKAWENLAKDTVIESVPGITTAPTLTNHNGKPVEAYLNKGSLTASVKTFSGSSWNSLGTTPATTDSITRLSLISCGSDIYLGALTSTRTFNVFKSAGGTSTTWTKVGDAISGTVSANLLCRTSNNTPFVTFVGTDKIAYYNTYSSSKWTKKELQNHVREIQSVFSGNNLISVFVDDTSSSRRAFYSIKDNNFNTVKAPGNSFVKNVKGISLALDNKNLYMGYLNQGTETYGPYVHRGTISNSDIKWETSGTSWGYSLFPGLLAYHISVSANGGKLYVAVDDKGIPSLAQSHVLMYDGSKWHMFGENQLPYFNVTFYNNNGYYLRGSSPVLSSTEDGKVYISMLAWENAGGSGKNFGPIVMQYVADKWKVK